MLVSAGASTGRFGSVGFFAGSVGLGWGAGVATVGFLAALGAGAAFFTLGFAAGLAGTFFAGAVFPVGLAGFFTAFLGAAFDFGAGFAVFF